MGGNYSTQHRPENGGNSAKHNKKLFRPGSSMMNSPTKFVCCMSANVWLDKLKTRKRLENVSDRKFIIPGEFYYELSYQILAKYILWLLCKCADTSKVWRTDQRTDRWTDGRKDKSTPVSPPTLLAEDKTGIHLLLMMHQHKIDIHIGIWKQIPEWECIMRNFFQNTELLDRMQNRSIYHVVYTLWCLLSPIESITGCIFNQFAHLLLNGGGR